MKDFVLITGNQQKADYLAKWLEHPISHKKVDLEEIQSLDLEEVVTHKARQAFELVREPVLVEDVSLSLRAMGRLPGTFIKWFLGEMGQEGICNVAARLGDARAQVRIMYAFYDGVAMRLYEAHQDGVIVAQPRGTNGFGWNHIFQPDGTDLTYAEMDENTYKHWNIRAHAIEKLKAGLKT